MKRVSVIQRRKCSPARSFLAFFLTLTQMLAPLPANASAVGNDLAASGVPPAAPQATTEKVTVNRTLPSVAPLPDPPVFSASPTDEEITRARIFSEPLLRTDETVKTRRGLLSRLSRVFDRPAVHQTDGRGAENQALAQALMKYVKSSDAEDLSPMTEFLKHFPNSGWRAGLLANLGGVYRRTGYFTRALNAFEEAWGLTRGGNGKNAEVIANWAAGKLAEMRSHLGHGERLEALFTELEGRDLYGPATEQVTVAKESLWRSRHMPEENFRCGPMALASIRAHQGLAEDAAILNARATEHGMSLKQVAALARQSGMKFQMARREAGAKIMVPAVAHWKVDHYSAIVERREEQGREYYLVQNPLFEREMWVSREALDEETSGYFLAPEGALPAGWRPATEEEAAAVWGRCYSGRLDTQQTMCYAEKVRPFCPTPSGMAGYNFHAMLVSLNIVDQPLGYSPPRGPEVDFVVTYNQREADQPNVFSFSNLGPKWTFDWLSYVEDRNAPRPTGPVTVYLRGGGQESYLFRSPLTIPQSLGADYMSRAELVLISANTSGAVYERRLPDGSREVFGQPDRPVSQGGMRRIFLTQIVDAAGNAVKLTYDAQMRVVAVTDALGQVTILSYELPGDPLKITKVTDPFGRTATLTYDARGRLIKITDVIGLASEFTYVDEDFISSLKTPYGTTTFRTGLTQEQNSPFPEISRYLQATDPLGETERLEYYVRVPGQPGKFGISYYWDRRTWKEAQGDQSKARHYKWTLLNQTLGSGVKLYEKQPLENAVNYGYPITNPNSPEHITSALPLEINRPLDDGATQKSRFQSNARGHLTKFTDPAGRGDSLVYDTNQIDLLEIYNDKTNETLARLSYNNQHLPLTYTDAAGQTTTFTYNPQGQVTSGANPKGEKTTFTYDARGYLLSVTGPVAGATTGFTYDGFGRPRTITDSEGYQVTIEYDALDRPIRVTYPDGTFEQIAYDRLDAARVRDRLGRITQATYDALRRLTSVTDPLGRVTKLEWCNCGDLGSLGITVVAPNILWSQ